MSWGATDWLLVAAIGWSCVLLFWFLAFVFRRKWLKAKWKPEDVRTNYRALWERWELQNKLDDKFSKERVVYVAAGPIKKGQAVYFTAEESVAFARKMKSDMETGQVVYACEDVEKPSPPPPSPPPTPPKPDIVVFRKGTEPSRK